MQFDQIPNRGLQFSTEHRVVPEDNHSAAARYGPLLHRKSSQYVLLRLKIDLESQLFPLPSHPNIYCEEALRFQNC